MTDAEIFEAARQAIWSAQLTPEEGRMHMSRLTLMDLIMSRDAIHAWSVDGPERRFCGFSIQTDERMPRGVIEVRRRL